MLDCFTHTGSFALNAALGGAAHVTAVDVIGVRRGDGPGQRGAQRSGSDVWTASAANVFDLLPQLEKEPMNYDFIILDPPAFTKVPENRWPTPCTGYKEINYRAMKLLPRGGYLATCSAAPTSPPRRSSRPNAPLRRSRCRACSCGRSRPASRACDHPILWGVDETDYLKFYLFQVV